jgi:spore germination cell wall hydrolase CwlJ-like protein
MAAGAAVGVAVGGAYLAGGAARDAMINAQNAKIALAAKNGISDVSLRDMAAGDPSALTVAMRYDPDLISGYNAHDHQAEQLAGILATKAVGGSNPLLRASVAVTFNPAAQPFRIRLADQARQMDCLSQAVYYEARGESAAGQAAVAQVVLNRVRHPAFPKSVCAVVYQGVEDHSCQFSFACDGSTREPREPLAWRRAQSIAAKAMSGYVMVQVGTATHFHVATLPTAWDGMLKVAEVGAHVFYRFSGVHGLPPAFNGKPRPDLAPANQAKPPILAAVALEPTLIEPSQPAPPPATPQTPQASTAGKTEPVA